MNRFSMYVVVAAMAVSGTGLMSYADDMSNTNTNATPSSTVQNMNNNNANNTLLTNRQMADATTVGEAQKTLADVVNTSVTAGKFDTLVSYLSKEDRNRIGDFKNQKQDDLDTAINQFRNDFKAKYGQEFNLQTSQLKNVIVYAGSDKKSALLSIPNPMTTPYQSSTGTTDATADRHLNTTGADITRSNKDGTQSAAALDTSTAGNRTGQANAGENSASTVHGNDVQANPGTVANGANETVNGTASTVVTRTTDMGTSIASGSTLNVVNEGMLMNAWRINIPDQISGQQLKDNLIKHIKMVDDMKAQWPEDANAAYRAVAYHIALAFNDSSIASDR